MSEEKLRQVFARNLKRQLEIHGKQPVDLVNDLHIPFSTVSNWINAAKFPRMGKIELLAQYFGIKKSDLTEEADEESQQQNYYTDQVTAQIAEDMATNPNLKMLYDVQRDMDPEDLQAMYNLAMALKRKTERLDSDDPA